MAEPARNCRSPLPRSVQHELIFGAPLRCAMAYGVRCYCSAPLHGCDEGSGELGKHSRKRPVCPRFSRFSQFQVARLACTSNPIAPDCASLQLVVILNVMPRDTEVRCGGCKQPLEEPPNLPAEQRQPCPACGARTRAFDVSVSETLYLHEKLGFKH